MPLYRNSSTVAAGTVAHFAASATPPGWLNCNGAAVSRATYAALFAAIGTTYGVGDGSTTFNVPDLRGEFIRGLDNGRGVDPARAIGSAQLDALQQHDHANALFASGGSNVAAAGASYTFSTAGAVAGARTATETRPRNVAMLACIKF